MKKLASLLLFVLISVSGYSQEPEMADTMRSNGKIYVVVSVIALILGGLIVYLVMIDRKASRLEKKLDQNQRS
jgi:hypothetical protein